MSESKIRIGITHGDFNGIGYEVLIKALSDPRMCELCTPVLYGSAKAAGYYKKQIEGAENLGFNTIRSAAEANPKRVNLIDCMTGDPKIEPGTLSTAAGESSVAALRMAAADLKAGTIDAVVTAPICKENVQGEGFPFTGHTEFFAAEFGGEPLMMMCSDLLKVGLVTIHIPLSEVAASISEAGIVGKLRALQRSLLCDFSIRVPAVQAASREGILAFGPFAADGFFASGSYTKYDAVLAMYHDQGLAPFKALCGGGVNFTAGLPVVRTSPAHGVGFDIAGQDKADESAMREAIYMAIDILRSRRVWNEISANPLRKFKRDTGADVSASDLPEEPVKD